MTFSKVQNPVYFFTLTYFDFSALPHHCYFSKYLWFYLSGWLKQPVLQCWWAIVKPGENTPVQTPSALWPLVGCPKWQETWPPRRWTVLIQRREPSVESSGYPCRYYGRQNEAHPFPAAWTMTWGIWGLWWSLVFALVVTEIESD